MRTPPARTIVTLAVCVAAALGSRWLATQPGGVLAARRGGADELSSAARAATFRFAPSVAPADRAWILAAVGAARPEARALIGVVDGTVTFSTQARASTALGGGADMMGEAASGPDGSTVWLNGARLDGDRAIDRPTVVLHELGHVVDFRLLSPDLRHELDAAIPRAATCGPGGTPSGACAPTAERIADTFAKWALGGAVSQVGSGYGIPTPPSLEDWGRPLGALAAGLPTA
jgi:hypothetical protein